MDNQLNSLIWNSPDSLNNFYSSNSNVNYCHFQNSRLEYILENQKQCDNDSNLISLEENNFCPIDSNWNYCCRNEEREMFNLFNLQIDENNLHLKQSEEFLTIGYKRTQ